MRVSDSVWHQQLSQMIKEVGQTQALEKLAARSMELQCTVQEGRLYFSSAAETVEMELAALKT